MRQHPGATIYEMVRDRGKTLADVKGVPLEDIQDVVAGRAPITGLIAFALSHATGIPVMFWMRLQKEYDEGKGSHA